MTTLHITRGLQGSGKSTFARAWVAEAPGQRVRLSRDDARDLYFGTRQGLTGEQEQFISDALEMVAFRALLDGLDVIYDATNLVNKHITPWLKIAQKAGAEVEYHDFVITREEALHRNQVRPSFEYVPREVINEWFDKRTNNGKLNPPPAPRKPNEWTEYVPDTSLPTAWICDLDGTLFDMNGKRGPFDMDKVEFDDIRRGTLDLIQGLAAAGDQIVYLSGRNKRGYVGSIRALLREGAPEGPLYMREDGDQRPDDVLKHELFYTHVAPNWNVRGAIDDRHSIMRLWHAIGVPAFSAAHPDQKEF